MPPTRGTGGGKRMRWRSTSTIAHMLNRKISLGGLRAPATLLHAAALDAAVTKGVSETLKAAAACKSGAR